MSVNDITDRGPGDIGDRPAALGFRLTGEWIVGVRARPGGSDAADKITEWLEGQMRGLGLDIPGVKVLETVSARAVRAEEYDRP